jgi:alkyldihydroxyacetonephosphate synthase
LLTGTIGPAELVERQREAIVSRLSQLGGEKLEDDAATRWFKERYDVETMMTSRNADAGRAFDTIEVSVPWSTAVACAAEIEKAMAEFSKPSYLHFSHAYTTGVCFYSILWLSAGSDAEVMARLEAAWATAMGIVVSHGGAIGHHHGIGAMRAQAYQTLADAAVHRTLKKALDPRGLLHGRLLQQEC